MYFLAQQAHKLENNALLLYRLRDENNKWTEIRSRFNCPLSDAPTCLHDPTPIIGQEYWPQGPRSLPLAI